MSVARLPIVVGIVAITGGIAWFALHRSSDDHQVDPQGSALLTPAGSGSGKAAIRAGDPSLDLGANAFDPQTPRPALIDGGAETVAIDAPSHREIFVTQTRDPRWAKKTEATITAQFKKLSLTTLHSIECRADQCEMILAGSTDEVSATIDKLETKQGLLEIATSVLLSTPEQTDGKMTLRAYALFERPQP
jgi:hypothetical protein